MILTKPGLNPRQTRLLAQIRPGERWPTGRAFAWYQEQGLATQRKTARDDFKRLTNAGYTVCIDDGQDRYFLLDTRVGATA